jgi:nucleoside-diphosphate-sugar epimerase
MVIVQECQRCSRCFLTDVETRLTDAYASRRILVTDGAAFMGSHLTEMLVRAGGRVTVADDLSSGRLEHLAGVEPRIISLRGHLREPEFARVKTAGQDVIFHLAASHGGRGCIDTHPVERTNNMLLDHTISAAAARGGVRKIVFASSTCVDPTNLQAEASSRFLLKESDANFDEPVKAFAQGEYGWAKLMGELQLRAFSKQFGLSGIAYRIFTAHGERESESHAVIALIAKAAARMDPFPIWGDGLQTRNFTYLRVTVTGMALAGAALDGFDVVNVGRDARHTILELLREIFLCMNWQPRQIQKQLGRASGREEPSGSCDQMLRETRLGSFLQPA